MNDPDSNEGVLPPQPVSDGDGGRGRTTATIPGRGTVTDPDAIGTVA